MIHKHKRGSAKESKSIQHNKLQKEVDRVSCEFIQNSIFEDCIKKSCVYANKMQKKIVRKFNKKSLS